jgi:acyl-CoA thioester hydrolase
VRPDPFVPRVLDGDERFVVDETTGLAWHAVDHRTLYADTDRSGVVYHANYLRYFELGRATLMRDLGYPYRAVEEEGFVYPIVDLGMSFHHPLRYDDALRVYTRPAKLERVRIRFEYVITLEPEGRLSCKGFTLHCALNDRGRPVAVDKATVRLWQRFPEP